MAAAMEADALPAVTSPGDVVRVASAACAWLKLGTRIRGDVNLAHLEEQSGVAWTPVQQRGDDGAATQIDPLLVERLRGQIREGFARFLKQLQLSVQGLPSAEQADTDDCDRVRHALWYELAGLLASETDTAAFSNRAQRICAAVAQPSIATARARIRAQLAGLTALQRLCAVADGQGADAETAIAAAVATSGESLRVLADAPVPCVQSEFDGFGVPVAVLSGFLQQQFQPHAIGSAALPPIGAVREAGIAAWVLEYGRAVTQVCLNATGRLRRLIDEPDESDTWSGAMVLHETAARGAAHAVQCPSLQYARACDRLLITATAPVAEEASTAMPLAPVRMARVVAQLAAGNALQPRVMRADLVLACMERAAHTARIAHGDSAPTRWEALPLAVRPLQNGDDEDDEEEATDQSDDRCDAMSDVSVQSNVPETAPPALPLSVPILPLASCPHGLHRDRALVEALLGVLLAVEASTNGGDRMERLAVRLVGERAARMAVEAGLASEAAATQSATALLRKVADRAVEWTRLRGGRLASERDLMYRSSSNWRDHGAGIDANSHGRAWLAAYLVHIHGRMHTDREFAREWTTYRISRKRAAGRRTGGT